ncbi:hypothetical protein L6452_26294 [Arctium lappa]|uniref:Uncharacterized protein n=1 Tax=Arctium lappa TaxID=4217 RepID=A0ACB9ADS1_ARCLA|nr:hypothetical protein L6452_26294 [Arctium lappa]
MNDKVSPDDHVKYETEKEFDAFMNAEVCLDYESDCFVTPETLKCSVQHDFKVEGKEIVIQAPIVNVIVDDLSGSYNILY